MKRTASPTSVAYRGRDAAPQTNEQVRKDISFNGLGSIDILTGHSIAALGEVFSKEDTPEQRAVHTDIVSGSLMRTLDEFVECASTGAEKDQHTREEYQAYADGLIDKYLATHDESGSPAEAIKMLPEYGGIREFAESSPDRFTEVARRCSAGEVHNQDQLAGYMLTPHYNDTADSTYHGNFVLFQDIANGVEHPPETIREMAERAGFANPDRVVASALEMQSHATVNRSLGFHAVVAAIHPDVGATYQIVATEGGGHAYRDARSDLLSRHKYENGTLVYHDSESHNTDKRVDILLDRGGEVSIPRSDGSVSRGWLERTTDANTGNEGLLARFKMPDGKMAQKFFPGKAGVEALLQSNEQLIASAQTKERETSNENLRWSPAKKDDATWSMQGSRGLSPDAQQAMRDIIQEKTATSEAGSSEPLSISSSQLPPPVSAVGREAPPVPLPTKEAVPTDTGAQEKELTPEQQEYLQRSDRLLESIATKRGTLSKGVLIDILKQDQHPSGQDTVELMRTGVGYLQEFNSEVAVSKREQLATWVSREVRMMGEKFFGGRIADSENGQTKAYDAHSSAYKRGETHGSSAEVVAGMLLDYISGDLKMSDDEMQEMRDIRDEEMQKKGTVHELRDGQHRAALVTLVDYFETGQKPPESSGEASDAERAPLSGEFSDYFDTMQGDVYAMKNMCDYGELPTLADVGGDIGEFGRRVQIAQASLEDMHRKSEMIVASSEERAPFILALEERKQQLEDALQTERLAEHEDISEKQHLLEQAYTSLQEVEFSLKKYQADTVYDDVTYVRNAAPDMLQHLATMLQDVHSRGMLIEEYDRNVGTLKARVGQAADTTGAMYAHISEQLHQIDVAMSKIKELY